MATNTAAQLDALFIQYHEKVIAPQFPQATPFLNQLKEAGPEWQVNAKGWKSNAYLRQEASNLWGLPGFSFPAGGTTVDKNYYVYRAKYGKSYVIDGSTYNDLRRGNDSTMLSESANMNRLMMNAAQELEQAAMGDGLGRKAIIESASTTVLTLKTTPNGLNASGFGADELIEQGVYDILTSAGALANPSQQAVTFPEGGIDRINNTVTLASAITAPAANSIIVYTGSYNMYPAGIRSLIDGARTGYFQGIDASTEPYLNSSKIDASQADISVNLVQNLMTKHIFRNGGQEKMRLKAFAAPTQIALYTQGGWNLVRYDSDKKDFNLGFDTASYGGVNFQSLVSMDPDVFVIADLADFRKLVGKKLEPHQEDGLLWRQSSGSNSVGSDNWYINYGFEGNYAITEPRRHAIITNLSVTGMATQAKLYSTSVS